MDTAAENMIDYLAPYIEAQVWNYEQCIKYKPSAHSGQIKC